MFNINGDISIEKTWYIYRYLVNLVINTINKYFLSDQSVPV